MDEPANLLLLYDIYLTTKPSQCDVHSGQRQQNTFDMACCPLKIAVMRAQFNKAEYIATTGARSPYTITAALKIAYLTMRTQSPFALAI